MAKIRIANHEKDYHSFKVETNAVSFNPKIGDWVKIASNKKAYPLTSTKRSTLAIIVGVEYVQNGGSTTDIVETIEVVNRTGVEIEVHRKGFQHALSSYKPGDALALNPSGRLVKAASAENYIMVVRYETLGYITAVFTLPNDLHFTDPSDTGVVIDPAIDENNDGVVSRKEILDANNDNSNSIADLMAIVNDTVVD